MTTQDTGRNSLPLNEKAKKVIADLPDGEQSKLDALIAAAADNQRDALENAVEGAVRLVPAPLRKQIRKVFLG